MPTLDPYERPPERIRNVYKKYQRMSSQALGHDPDIVDLDRDHAENSNSRVRVVTEWDPRQLTAIFRRFASESAELQRPKDISSVPVYEHEDMPGLLVVPSLLPSEVQLTLLSRLLHRDLAQPSHLTNIHTHYNISYPSSESSFFALSPNSSQIVADPIDPSVHRPLGVSQLLNKKMRWMTLGGQYDWTKKRYPDGIPPCFPSDIKTLLESIFTDTRAEAAIVNLYSPGDTLSVHRDVAEFSDTGLISISLGCDAIFVIGTSPEYKSDSNNTEERVLAIRLRSGSAVYMSGASRFAWHGVPQIVPDTCPADLESWPAGENEGDSEYDEWRGWMARKRINVNVRQMWD